MDPLYSLQEYRPQGGLLCQNQHYLLPSIDLLLVSVVYSRREKSLLAFKAVLAWTRRWALKNIISTNYPTSSASLSRGLSLIIAVVEHLTDGSVRSQRPREPRLL
jgi:hypothetical protein